MNKPAFSYQDCIIAPKLVTPPKVLDSIMVNHIIPMTNLKENTNINIMVSSDSMFRHPKYEQQRGRNANSNHCFGLKPDGTFDELEWKLRGATDWTFDDFDENLDEMLCLFVKYTRYRRLAIYHDAKFIHADYRVIPGYEEEKYVRVYHSDNKSNWVYRYQMLYTSVQ